jgi:hypothetical protein
VADEKTKGSESLKIDTPQKDSDWSEQRKLEWVKGYTAHVLDVLNKRRLIKQES